jgi:putative DNA primase/helicase
MTAGIFATFADRYWEKGVSVIPLFPNQKRPCINIWTEYAKRLPDEITQNQWKTAFAEGNIGLAAGKQSNLVFIDIDTDNSRVISIIESVLPSSPWKRIGAKGYVAAYRYHSGLESSFQIKDGSNKVLVEMLSTGRQVVLPPSIHPDTKKPYYANCNLLDVLDEVAILPQGVETLLREAFQSEGIELSHSGFSKVTEFVPAGARDSTMISLAGLCSMDITRGRMTLQESFDRMAAWYETLTQSVEGDAIDLSKGQQKIMEFLQRDVCGEKQKPLPLGWDRGLDEATKVQLASVFNEEHKEWKHDELKEYIRKGMEEHIDPRSPKRYEVIEYVLARISRSPSLNTLEKEMLLKYICDVSRIPGLTLPNLRKRIKEISSGSIAGTDHTEIAKATIDHISQYGELRYEASQFWQWRGANWEVLHEGEILKAIAEEFGEFAAARKHSDHKGILAIMETILPQGLATNKMVGINFANYFLTMDGKRMPHIPELGCTFTLPYRYVPEQSHRAPLFMKFLDDCWGEDYDYSDKVEALQEMMCVTLFGMGYVYQRASLLYGKANSGKSTLMLILKSLFPSNMVSVVPPDQWGDKFAPTEMYNKLLNVCGELPEKKLIDGKSFKEIVDGSEIIGQYKGRQLFKFQPKATHWFASNHLPKTLDTSEGFNRRLLILTFKKPVSAENKVLGLHDMIIEQEREAIVAWAIEAAPRLQANRDFTLPLSHVRCINEMASENNSVRFFLLECPKVVTSKKLQLMMLESNSMGMAARTNKTSKMVPQEIPTQGYTLGGTPIPLSSNSGSAALRDPEGLGANIALPQSVQDRMKLLERNGLSLTLEDPVYSEYTAFCLEVGGVRSVGLRAFRKRMTELEHEFGFKVHTEVNAMGAEVHGYEGLIIAPKSTGNPATSVMRTSQRSAIVQ